MKRKMVHIGLSYISGLFFASFFNMRSQLPFVIAAAAIFVIFCLIKKPSMKHVIVWITAFVTGFSVYTGYDRCVYDKITSYAGEEIQFTGKITQISDYEADSSSYVLKGNINGQCRAKILLYADKLECSIGDSLTFEAQTDVFENTYLFALKDYNKSNGIYIKAVNPSDITVIQNHKFSFYKAILDFRNSIIEKIRTVLNTKNSAVIIALLFGEKDSLGENTQSLLYRCGIGHAMAVSGMHLAVAAAMISSVLKKTFLKRKLRFLILEISVILFVIFSGMSVSVIRAAIMMTLVYGAAIFARKPDILNSLCIAAAAMSLFNPFIIHNSSFLLSWTGTFAVGVFAPFMTKQTDDRFITGKIKKYAVSAFCISAAVFPVSVMYFDEISVVSLLSDILILPLCICGLICGLIVSVTAGVSFIAYPVLMIGAVSASLILKISDVIGRFSFSYIASGYTYMCPAVLVMALFVVFTALRWKKPSLTAWSIIISAFVMCISSFVYRYSDMGNLKIYNPGDDKSGIIAVEYNGNVDIIDLCGSTKDAGNASKLCRGFGFSKVNSLSLPQNPYTEAVSFDRHMALTHVSHVYLPEQTFISEDCKICGCYPEYLDFSIDSIMYSDYSIIFNKNQTVTVVFKDNTITCSCSGIRLNDYMISDISDSVIRINKQGRISIRDLQKGADIRWA